MSNFLDIDFVVKLNAKRSRRFDLSEKATLEVKTRHFVTTLKAVKSIKMLYWPDSSTSSVLLSNID